MKKKKTIKDLLALIESDIQCLDAIDISIEDTLDKYKKTLSYSKELLLLLEKQKKAYTLLKQESNELFKS